MTSEEKELQELVTPLRELTDKEKGFISFVIADKAELWRKLQERGLISMTKVEFYPVMEEIFEKVKELFSQKNESYGQDQGWL